MQKKIPIQYREKFKLESLGIDSNNISYDSLTMDSDKFICVRDKSEQKGGLTIVDVNKQEVSQISRAVCESAIMHPTSRVIALRVGQNLQTYNLELKSQVKKAIINKPVEFWTWINVKEIAIVTDTQVSHWSMSDDKGPVKVFDKHEWFEGATVINYKTDETGKWLLLMGFKKIDGFTGGVMQLYSVDKNVTQPIQGHAGVFINFKVGTRTVPLICIASKNKEEGNLFIMELPISSTKTFEQKKVSVEYASPTDFPIAMEASERFGVIYMITKAGYLYLFDVETATTLFRNKITQTPIFATVPSGNGFIGVNRSGSVLSVGIDENKIIPYLISVGQSEIAMKITSRANLSGADDLYKERFDIACQQGNAFEAVMIAAKSPNMILRTPEVIMKLAKLPVPPPPNNKPPLSIYFQYIIENVGQLNQFESVELGKIVLQKQGGLEYLQNLIKTKKMTPSEQLGDLVKEYSAEFALKIYFNSKVHHKIVSSLVSVGDWQRVVTYIDQVKDYKPDYVELFTQILRINPDSAVKFASHVYKNDKEAFDPNIIVNLFVQTHMIKQATEFLLGFLKEDREEDKDLQTKLLEINLKFSPPQVADQILGKNYFTHYDHQKIAILCERVQLFQRALENYSNINDVKRVIVNTKFIDNEWLVDFFGDMLPEESLQCLYELLKSNIQQNLKLVVRVAIKYSAELTPESLIKMFESFRSYNGLYYYLFSIVDKTKDADIVFKFIESAVRCGQLNDVERVTRENDVYEGEKVKEFLKEARLSNLVPLINVCDKHYFIEELIHYLYNNKHTNYIDMYVQQRNSHKTPEVISALIDCDATDEYIKKLINSVGGLCPVQPLVEAVEKKKQLKLLKEWLEERVKDGNKEPITHNSLAKIYIDINNSPEVFLNENEFYDNKEIGEYCEKRRDPNLALLCYKRGKCDLELMELTNKNGLFKDQAKYLVERQDADLWKVAFDEENKNRRLLIDQIVQSALLECKDADMVSTTVHAFIVANLPMELLELLEQIVLKGNSEFKNNKSLQDLLIITAIKADQKRVMGYIKRMDKYNGTNIASIAIQKGLFEEAFVVYDNNKMHPQAMGVLVEHIKDLERGESYAEKIGDNECYAILGRALLNEDKTDKAIECFLKAKITSDYKLVIAATARTGHYKELIKFLQVARKQNHHDSQIDTELAYAFAKEANNNPTPNNFADLEDFISGPGQQTNVQDVGDRCFDEEMYESARICYSTISNYSKLASTLVKQGKNREAVQAATKADSIKTWKEVLKACVEAKDFRYAQSCGLNIIIHADEIDELVYYYESLGFYDEAISLLEKGLGLSQEQSHKGIPTALGLLYAKYHPNKLMEHLQRYHRRSHTSRLIQACEQNHLWAELRFLHTHNNNFDEAVVIMMKYPVDAWEHNIFTESIVNVINTERFYDAINFYLEEHPHQLVDLLHVLTAKALDHERVAKKMIELKELPLIKKYLESIQDKNLLSVNEALNKLYIEEENYEALIQSIEQFDNYDHYTLAKALETHELLEFRRISASIFRTILKYKESIELSKKDKLYQDAMETAAESGSREIAEDLLNFFVTEKLKDCFSACLYHCYHLIRPDYGMELAWKNNIMDMAMPFLIQVLAEYTQKCDNLEKKIEKSEVKKEEKEEPKRKDNPFFGEQNQGYNVGGIPGGMSVGGGMIPGGMTVGGGMIPGGMPPGGMPPGGMPPGGMNVGNNDLGGFL